MMKAAFDVSLVIAKGLIVKLLGSFVVGLALLPALAHAQSPAAPVGARVVTASAAIAPAHTDITAFVNVAVVPMDRERVLANQTVVVRDGQIIAFGPSTRVRVPVGATRIDGRGKFLIPGLTDMHAHVTVGGWPTTAEAARLLSGRNRLFRYVASGVTTIREMNGNPQTLQLKAEAATGAILSPRLYVSVRPGSEGLARLSSRPDSAVRLAKLAGFDLIKFWGAPTGDVLDSILAVAARVGLPIAGHPPTDDNLLAIREHYRSVEHLLGFWSGERAPHNGRDDVQLATAHALKQAGVWVCPTLNHMVRIITSSSDAWTDTTTLYRAIRILRDVGVGLLAGTDAMAGPMSSYLVSDELARLVVAGLTPYQALLTATRNPAAYFETLDSTGTVAVGKRADLVLLAGNPLTDIRHTAAPVGVMLGGRWLPRAELEQVEALLLDPKQMPDLQ